MTTSSNAPLLLAWARKQLSERRRAISENARAFSRLYALAAQSAPGIAGLVTLLLARLHPLLPALLIATALPRFSYERRLGHYIWTGLTGRSPHWRWLGYCARVLCSADHAKEVRLFGLGDFFLDRYRKTFERA